MLFSLLLSLIPYRPKQVESLFGNGADPNSTITKRSGPVMIRVKTRETFDAISFPRAFPGLALTYSLVLVFLGGRRLIGPSG